jgi:hypothetical protein
MVVKHLLVWGGLVFSLATADAQTAMNRYVQAILGDHPTVYYQMNESPGASLAVDSSGKGNAGYYSEVTLGTPGASPVLGTSAAFNGASSFIAVPPLGEAISLGGAGNGELTIELWINPEATTGGSIYSYDGWQPGALNYLWDWTGAGIQFSLKGNAPTDAVFDADPPIPTNQWTFIASVYTAGQSTVATYLNGHEAGEAQYTAAGAVDLEPAEIGAWAGGGRFFSGFMQHFAIYTNALAPAEIQAHYLEAFSAPVLFASKAGDRIILSWDSNGFILQENSNLMNPSGWTTIPAATNSPVTLPIDDSATFYRLISE